ncbi:16S rRNA pseudouridine(516) synthase [Carboxydothermus islandicus]|uniref:Pseudouridine synthase n=1 Tax=Carboxydothermus islandicus TaxID=661089 RepID=A0A1L8D1U3_9THEO|nr:pseudouridine synthase [Carboxydothermus islandicus]GAV25071.1 16S rRNA pseudouridine(516) synthase [Carboxydothermus islandicus]
MRIDKFLAHMGYGTRKEVRKLLKAQKVEVNGVVVKDPGYNLNVDTDKVIVKGEEVKYKPFVYFMLNKPQGYVSATVDRRYPTVVDLVPFHREIFPVGRLDIDTEGLLILTDDGQLAHHLTSPKKEVEKEYYFELDKPLEEDDFSRLKAGIRLEDNYLTKPARLLGKVGDKSGTIVITEGKYHQVKRMFLALGKTVVYLKRIRIGGLILDSKLSPGEYRELTPEEISILKNS